MKVIAIVVLALALVACGGDDARGIAITVSEVSSTVKRPGLDRRSGDVGVDRILTMLERGDLFGLTASARYTDSADGRKAFPVRNCLFDVETRDDAYVRNRLQQLVDQPYTLFSVAQVPDGFIVPGRHAITLWGWFNGQTASAWILEQDGLIVGLSDDCGASDVNFYQPPLAMYARPLPGRTPQSNPARRSGNPTVNRVLDALATGDLRAIDAVLDAESVPCSKAPDNNGEVFPVCRPNEPEGTLVDVVASGGCHGGNFRRDDAVKSLTSLTRSWANATLYSAADRGGVPLDFGGGAHAARGSIQVVLMVPGSIRMDFWLLELSQRGLTYFGGSCNGGPVPFMWTYDREPKFLIAPQ